jgi:hypothetical protein
VIDGKAKPGVFETININDVLQPSFNDLWGIPYNSYVRKWEERHQLRSAERCRKGDWTVTVGNPKGNTPPKYQASNDMEWRKVHGVLRHKERYGDKKSTQWAHSLHVECEWFTVDREKTPPVDPKASKGQP